MRDAWWKVFGVVLVAALVLSARAHRKAMAIADVAADSVERLQEGLLLLEEDTVRLSHLLIIRDSANAARARRDSTRIAELTQKAATLEGRLAELAAADPAHTESVESALVALEARLGPDDLPALRTVTRAYAGRIAGLQGQIVLQEEQLALKDEELGLVRGELFAEREARRADDALVDGLRDQIVQLTEIRDTQAREIEALRSAPPGFSIDLGSWWLLPLGIGIGLLAR